MTEDGSDAHEIKMNFPTHTCTIRVLTDGTFCPPKELHFHGILRSEEWKEYGEPLVAGCHSVTFTDFEFSERENTRLIFRDGANLFVYAALGNHTLFRLRNCPAFLTQQFAEDSRCARTNPSYKKLLLDKLKQEHKEKTRLILSKTQSQYSFCNSQPKSTFNPAQSCQSDSEEILKANKERLKKYMLYELTKAGIPKEHSEFNAYWKSLYANCQFQLRKNFSNTHMKREALFNCVKSNLKSLLA